MARKTILVIEDEPDVQRLYKEILAGYAVIPALNTKQAMDKLKKAKKVELIILDVILPGEKGDEFLKKIKQMPKYSKIPVICITVVSELVKTIKKIDPKTLFIPKPFENKEFLSAIKKKLK
jgi:CheY-like chemotaxis protein